MPANPKQIHAAVRELGARIMEQSQEREAAEHEALRLLHQWAGQPDRLRGLVASVVASSEPGLRCALPGDEGLEARFLCMPSGDSCTVVAVDGSQVVPDRHEEILFALINIGTVRMQTNSGLAPDIYSDSSLLFGRDLYPGNGPLISEGEIALRRDTRERTSLLEHADPASGISVALTDGPLELWGAKDAGDPRAYENALREYLEVLRELQERRWIVAGYVDKPGADLVTRLLELTLAGPEDLRRLRQYHPLQGASDRWLFGQLLEVKQRSAIFEMQSTSKLKYPGGLAIHFFYLNVGAEGHPWIARVEIPKWVAEHPPSIDALQALLLEQCAVLGVRPYPYILHRAHETARISDAEKEQIKLQIMMEMRRHGQQPDAQSSKSSIKARSDLKGRF